MSQTQASSGDQSADRILSFKINVATILVLILIGSLLTVTSIPLFHGLFWVGSKLSGIGVLLFAGGWIGYRIAIWRDKR